MQVQQDSFYFTGMFPSYRHYGLPQGKMKEDNNIFFTGLIALTLGDLLPQLHGADSARCAAIIAKARQSFKHFRHSEQRHTYNFWKTHPKIVFPNSWFLNLFAKWHALPDDLDDTSILLMSQQVEDSIVRAVKMRMEAHANLQRYRIRNTFRQYRDIPAYSTWFGASMPIDFDFCVLTNTLLFVQRYQLPYSRQDSATVHLLELMIRDRAYMHHPAYISPHYARSPILIYHIARLLKHHPIPSLMQYRSQLIADAQQEWKDTENGMDRTILGTALTWLGDRPPAAPRWDADTDFIFFVAGFNSLLPNPLKKMFTLYPVTSYYYRCPAYNRVLQLEYILQCKM